MPNTQTHTEKIKCPDCGTIQDATVEHTIPFHTYLHNCEKCNFTIMESDWEVVPNTKQLTAMQELISYQANLIKEQGHKLSAYEILNMVSTKTVELLPTERQNLIDAANSNVTGEYYYNETFKPNK